MAFPHRRAAGKLRNHIRDQVILDYCDLVFQFELALLKPGDLQLIGRACAGQRVDRGVKIAVFHFEDFEPLLEFLFIHGANYPFYPLVAAAWQPAAGCLQIALQDRINMLE